MLWEKGNKTITKHFNFIWRPEFDFIVAVIMYLYIYEGNMGFGTETLGFDCYLCTYCLCAPGKVSKHLSSLIEKVHLCESYLVGSISFGGIIHTSWEMVN